MKILVMTDMEGVAGILNHDDWVVPTGRFYAKGMRLLTREVNAAIDGFFAAGADQVVVVDGHGHGGIDPELLDERAWLSRGPSEHGFPGALDDTCQAVAFVGQHAKAGTPYSHLSHTQGFNYLDLTVNGLSLGEYGQVVLCAAELGIPTILAAGEEALCREAEALTPGVVTVAGKRGLLPDGLDDLDTDAYRGAKLGALHKSPAVVRRLLRRGAEQALQKLHRAPESFQYPQLTAPFTATFRFRRNGMSPPYEVTLQHPRSFRALMNLPIPGPAAAAGRAGNVTGGETAAKGGDRPHDSIQPV